MSVCYSMGKTCKVCGSRISDNNTTGIGCECRYSYNKARKTVFFDERERGLKYYAIEADSWMPLFIKTFKDTKFRSKFKKSFYPSIVEQYTEKGFVSKKQLEICKSMLRDKISSREHENIFTTIDEQRKALIDNHEFNKEEKEKIVNLANKFRHEFRANK